MKSRERVGRALNFDKPDRVPIFKIPLSDFFPLFAIHSKKWQPDERNVYPHLMSPALLKLRLYRWKRPNWAPRNWRKLDREEVDEWGCYWNVRMSAKHTMGTPGRPRFVTWDDMEDWTLPDPHEKARYKLFNRLSKLFARNKYRLAMLDPLFVHRITYLRGFNNFLTDHRRHPNKIHELVKRIKEYQIATMEEWVEHKVDGYYVCDDLGSQLDLFFSPEIFKKFYADAYKELSSFAHDHSCTFTLHSCGNIGKIIPTLIDIGIDGLELDSPRMTGFDTLQKFRGKIPIWGCVNIQTIYPNGTPAEVEEETKQMISTLGTEDGGFVGFPYASPAAIKIPKQNQRAFVQALKKWGNYPLTWT